MKTFQILLILLTSFAITNCDNDNETFQENKSKRFEVDKPNFRLILLGDGQTNEKIGGPARYGNRTESDYVSNDNGCYTVNVRVYVIDYQTGQEWLAANDNVEVGECDDDKNLPITTACSGILKNGNRVIKNGSDAHICLYEVLTKNKEVYKKYKESLDKLLE